jgi:hypothetical protein
VAQALALPVVGPAEANICGTNVTVGAAVMDALNLSWPGLEPVAAAAAAGDLTTACAALAVYFNQTATTGAWLRWQPPKGFNYNGTARAGGLADNVLQDIYYLSGVDTTARIPRSPDGGLDW